MYLEGKSKKRVKERKFYGIKKEVRFWKKYKCINKCKFKSVSNTHTHTQMKMKFIREIRKEKKASQKFKAAVNVLQCCKNKHKHKKKAQGRAVSGSAQTGSTKHRAFINQ